jgi:hypothetical protein
MIGVGSCNGHPAVEATESADNVSVRVTSYVPNGDRNDCQDVVSVKLERPLQGRVLIDGTNGSHIAVSTVA